MATPGYVYIMASRRNGTLYLGATSNIVKRAWEHRNLVVPGFTKRYHCILLVWYAAFDDIQDARACELRIANEEMEPSVETAFDRRGESGLERPVSDACALMIWVSAFAETHGAL